ncbi:MAG TPA: hypothetical protein VGH28_12765 [Polyangiaceae bacterium]|jgi:hypothetical protein
MAGELRKVFELGPTAQPIVAGVYAWAVTVAPVGFEKHGPRGLHDWPAVSFATLALLALASGAAVEIVSRRAPGVLPGSRETWRTLALLAFVGASLVTWICDTDALSPARMSAARGIAGMLGWGLFAFAFAAPVVEPVGAGVAGARVVAGARARGRVERGDAVFVAIACAAVLALQLVGWNVQAPERAILVRLTTLFAGIVILGGVGLFLSSRHGALKERPARARVRAARTPLPLGWVIALLLLLVAGLMYALTS